MDSRCLLILYHTGFSVLFLSTLQFREARIICQLTFCLNSGISAALSYHIRLNKRALSFLSIGASAKGMYHFYRGNSDLSIPNKEFYFPNVDAGIYLYNPNSYIGLSVTNLLDPQ